MIRCINCRYFDQVKGKGVDPNNAYGLCTYYKQNELPKTTIWMRRIMGKASSPGIGPNCGCEVGETK